MSRGARRNEAGVALVAALIVMMLVVGIIAIFSVLAVGESRQGRADRQRAESLNWVETASAQVLTQLRAHDIGPQAMTGAISGAQLWSVPGGSGRRPLSITMPDGTVKNGFFEILPPMPGAAANTVAYVRSAVNGQQPGDVVLVLRGSTSASDPHPRAARVVFRRSSLARYSMVSDAPIDIGNLGTARLGGSIHSNNIERDAVGVRVSGASNAGGTRRISATHGTINGGCPASRCIPDSGEAVSFTNIDHAFAEVERLAANRNGCARGIACVISGPVSWHPAGTAPTYRVRLDGSGGCVVVDRIAQRLRVDAGYAAIVDDRFAPVGPYGSVGTFCPRATPGGQAPLALLFNSDVQVQGVRAAGAAPVTIMTRNTSNPTTIVNGGSTTRQQPASIYLLQTGSTLGSMDSLAPVGLIAEGSVYLPSWAIGAGNNRMQLQNVAIAAKEGEFGLGPMSLAMAGSLQGLSGSGSDPTEGGGLNPCSAAANTFDTGGHLTIVGAVASRREPVLGYGTSNACSFGYTRRTYTYGSTLEWNPPPLYPTTSPWHVAEWDELAVGG